MITPSHTTRTGLRNNDSLTPVVSIRRGGNNRLSLLAMMVPLLLLCGLGLTGLLRQDANRPPLPDTLAKAEIETIVSDLSGKLTGATPEIVSTTLQVAYAVQEEKPFPEWSVVSRTEEVYYLFRINGRNGRVFAINRLDDVTGQAPNLSHSGQTIEAGLAPLLPEQARNSLPKEFSGNGKQAAESAARRYLPVLGLMLRDVYRVPNKSERSYPVYDMGSVIWTFTYHMKSGTPAKSAIKVSVDSGTGRLESFWNPFFSH